MKLVSTFSIVIDLAIVLFLGSEFWMLCGYAEWDFYPQITQIPADSYRLEKKHGDGYWVLGAGYWT